MDFILYGKSNCSLCEEAKQILHLLQSEYVFQYQEIDIYTDESLVEKYHISIPVLEYNGTIVDEGNIDYSKVQNFLQKKNFSENS